ncbi:MAG: ATP-binding cassette domain-containing protein, partial [Erysipelotrichaceae bacterium]|nr:ATP-binding cassette domain-containing protein [Erysipelotrichaceae bacterium]
VGPTGAGKTTITNLLLRFYTPQNGRISINGCSIQDLSFEDLRNLYGLVLQDPWLFEGTVRENLLYGCPEASEQDMISAAKKAGVHELIEQLPEGYQTVLQEDAENISQGEKQLLTIVRALIRDPKILILDEATSSVDTRMERKLQKAMDVLMEKRTCFVIAHRLSTIVNADLILVVSSGELAEQGTHEQLMAKNGLYASLYLSQFRDGQPEN